MKKIYLLAVLVIAFTACTRENMIETPSQSGNAAVTRASAPELADGAVEYFTSRVPTTVFYIGA